MYVTKLFLYPYYLVHPVKKPLTMKFTKITKSVNRAQKIKEMIRYLILDYQLKQSYLVIQWTIADFNFFSTTLPHYSFPALQHKA